MTNLQNSSSVISATMLRRLWLFSPVVAGLLVAVALAMGLLLPMWNTLQQDSKRMRELEQLRDEVGLLRAQIARQIAEEEKVTRSRVKLVELITGNGNLSTFLAMVDEEAQRAGIRLDLYEPQAAPAEAATGSDQSLPGGALRGGANNRRQSTKSPAAGGPIEVPGLERRGLLLSAHGRYPNLLDFLRRLERRNVLVLQSDLNLSSAQPKDKTNQPIPQTAAVQMKLSVSLYARPDAAAGAATPPPTPSPAG